MAGHVVPTDQQPAMRDVLAILTVVIANDMDAVFDVIADCEDPRFVLAGLAGMLTDFLPDWAKSQGIDDLAAIWPIAATEANRRMEHGEPLG